MANNIAYIKNYTTIIDEVYKRAMCAAVEAFANYGDGAVSFMLGNFKSAVRDGVAFSTEDNGRAAMRPVDRKPKWATSKRHSDRVLRPLAC